MKRLKNRILDEMVKKDDNISRELLLKTPQKEIYHFLKEKGWKILYIGEIGVAVDSYNPIKPNSMLFVMKFIGSKIENVKSD
jgi:hypothetical protein